jgi:hypothetical protein
MRASRHSHRAGQLSKNTIEWFKKRGTKQKRIFGSGEIEIQWF